MSERTSNGSEGQQELHCDGAEVSAPVEREPQHRPRVYIASLSDYNAGRLHGRWMDAAREVEDLQADIQAMLEASPEPVAEEFAIHDHEGFAQASIGEYESLEVVSAVARGIAQHGEAFAAWASIVSNDVEALARFEDGYLGTWDSAQDYAQSFFDDSGAEEALATLPEWLRPHVKLDVTGFARDLELGGDITVVAGEEGGVHVFDGTG